MPTSLTILWWEGCKDSAQAPQRSCGRPSPVQGQAVWGLENTGQWKASLPWQGWNERCFRVLSKPGLSRILWKRGCQETSKESSNGHSQKQGSGLTVITALWMKMWHLDVSLASQVQSALMVPQGAVVLHRGSLAREL